MGEVDMEVEEVPMEATVAAAVMVGADMEIMEAAVVEVAEEEFPCHSSRWNRS